MVLVSIIIPTYNRKDLLIKAVESILLQTYSNWELLIINDYENPIKLNFNDTRISIQNNKFTKGGNGARNTGLSMAKGNFIAFLDDDDEWEKDKLSKQIEIMNDSKNVLCYTGKKIFKNSSFNKSSYKKYYFSPKATLYLHNYIGTISTIMIRAEVINKNNIKFDESLHVLQDYDFYLQLVDFGAFIGIKQNLIKYNFHQNRQHTSLNVKAFFCAIIHILLKQKGLYKLIIFPGLFILTFQKIYNQLKHKIILF